MTLDLKATPLDLAVFRITVPVIVLISPQLYAADDWAALPQALRVAPEGMRGAMELIAIAPALARVGQWVLGLACVTAILGLCSRLSLAVVTLAGLYVFGHSQIGGTVQHDMHLFWFTALLAVSPCGDALALDRRLARGRSVPVLAASTAHGSPLQAVRLLLGVIYFFPGLHKLLASGPAWIFSDNLLNQMHWRWYQMGGFTPFIRVDRFPYLLRIGALFVVVFELSFFALALVPRLRPFALAGGLLFHGSTQIFMNLSFSSLWLCYTALVDWGALGRRLRGGAHAAAASASAAVRRAWPSQCVAVLLIAASAVQGARGSMQAWPFACYPTFERMVGPLIPDLRIEVVRRDGTVVAVPDGPGTGGRRELSRWGMAWSVSGLYGQPVQASRLRGYYEVLERDPRVRSVVEGATTVRCYLAYYSVRPERFGAPPVRMQALAEWALVR